MKEQEEMGKHVVEHFSKAFVKDNFVGNSIIRRSLINSIPRILGVEENNLILGSIIEEEVKSVVFSMKTFKARLRWVPSGVFPAFLGGG